MVERGHSRISRFQGQEDSSSFMVRHPPPLPPLDTDVDVNTAQCGTVWGRSSFSHFTHTSLCQKSALLPFRKQNVRTNKQRCPSKDFSKKQKNEPSYQNTNFSLWTEPLWFLISPMIVAFPHQISPRPPPPHFRVFSQGRVLVFIKGSEVIRLSFLLLSRLWAAIGPSPPIYRSLHWTSSLTLWQPCHRTANLPPSAPSRYASRSRSSARSSLLPRKKCLNCFCFFR